MVVNDRQKNYFADKYQAIEGRYDTYELFLEKGINLCGRQGLLGYIVPNTLLSNLYGRKLRRFILSNCTIQEVTNFGMEVFGDPTVHTCIIVLSREQKANHAVQIRKQVASIQELCGNHDYELRQELLGNSDKATFDIFVDSTTQKLMTKLGDNARLLGEICFIRQCIKTGNDKIYVQSSDVTPSEPWKPTLRGRSINRYAILDKNLYVKYGPWLARNWKNKSFYETPKISVRETGNRVVATLDLENRYLLSSLYAIYPKRPGEILSLSYILGILNSALALFFLKKIALELTKGAFTKFRTNQLARLPICTLDFNDPTNKARHDRMVGLVKRMLDLNKQLAEAKAPQAKTILQRQIEATDRQIDRLVYELYGLTDEEIKIVEKSLR